MVVVRSGGQTVLIDAELGMEYPDVPRAGRLALRLEAAGIDLASVTDVVLTHMHMDHVGGLLADGVRGRLRQVSGHQRLAGRRQLPQKTDVGYWPLADMPRSRLV